MISRFLFIVRFAYWHNLDKIKIVVLNIHDDNNISPLLICMPFPKHFYIYYFIYMYVTIFHNSQDNLVKSAEQKSTTIFK